MTGRLKSDQGQLFYESRLGDAALEDHLVWKIDTAFDLSWLRCELAPHYWFASLSGQLELLPLSFGGRPSGVRTGVRRASSKRRFRSSPAGSTGRRVSKRPQATYAE